MLQLVQAVEGAVVGLRDQLEALTILDETALTWPGLSLVRAQCNVCWSVAYAAVEPMRFARDKMQVLEDLEALVKLLSSRASHAEGTASSLQKQVTSLHAAADQSSKDQAACSAQLHTSKKEAGIAKRVLVPATLLCTKLASASMLKAYQVSGQTFKNCMHLVLKRTCPVTYVLAFL